MAKERGFAQEGPPQQIWMSMDVEVGMTYVELLVSWGPQFFHL